MPSGPAGGRAGALEAQAGDDGFGVGGLPQHPVDTLDKGWGVGLLAERGHDDAVGDGAGQTDHDGPGFADKVGAREDPIEGMAASIAQGVVGDPGASAAVGVRDDQAVAGAADALEAEHGVLEADDVVVDEDIGQRVAAEDEAAGVGARGVAEAELDVRKVVKIVWVFERRSVSPLGATGLAFGGRREPRRLAAGVAGDGVGGELG